MAGFDFGLKSFLTVHDGFESYEIASPELFKQSLKSVKALSRCLSRKAEGSNNRRKARARLARAHRAIANKRLGWFFKLSHDLTERYDYLFFETLNLKGMQRLWGRKVSDLAFGMFLNVLQYVANKKGKVVALIDPFFPSSRLCPHCGCINEHL